MDELGGVEPVPQVDRLDATAELAQDRHGALGALANGQGADDQDPHFGEPPTAAHAIGHPLEVQTRLLARA